MNPIRILLAGMLLIATPAFAHEAKGPNGGRIVDATPYHIELVVKDRRVAVYLTDANEKPLPVTGFKGIAILLVSGKSQRITLVPDQDSRLAGSAEDALPAEPKGVVQLTDPAGKTAQGRFN